MLRASRCSVERVEGRMTQRITRERTSGEMLADCSAEMMDCWVFAVEGLRARRKRVQSGMVTPSAMTSRDSNSVLPRRNEMK